MLFRSQVFKATTTESGVFQRRRDTQLLDWMHAMIDEHLHNLFFGDAVITGRMPEIKDAVLRGIISPTQAVAELVKMFDITRAAQKKVSLFEN